MLLHEANQILHLIGLPSLDPSILAGCYELLGDIRLFVYPDVRKHFALSFAEDGIQLGKRTFPLDYAIRAYFDYYSTHPELVQHNIDFYSRSSDATLSRIASSDLLPTNASKDLQAAARRWFWIGDHRFLIAFLVLLRDFVIGCSSRLRNRVKK